MDITIEELRSLAELQTIEVESVRIESLLKKVTDKTDTIDRKYKDALVSHTDLEDDLNSVKDDYKKLDTYVTDINERLVKNAEYLKTVSTQKEYKVLLRETDENKKKSSKMEDEMIELLDIIEEKEKLFENSKNDLFQLKTTVENEIRSILDESVEERQELEIIQKKKDKITPSLKPRLLMIYNNLLVTGSRKAVINLKKNTCTGCFVTLPPQFFIEVRKGGELFFCPQCQRIIFWDEENVTKES